MKLRFLKIMAIGLFLVYMPAQSFAWGQLGHRIVAEIADSYLSKKAKKEIKKILGAESMAMSSTWADFIKSERSYKYLDTWHYVDFEKGVSCEEIHSVVGKDTSANAYNKIEFLISELKNKALPKEKKVMYLRLLIHLVGDIHQPYHVGYHDDRGGNDIKVTWFNKPTNMHTIWDSELIEFQQLSYTEYVKSINHTTAAQREAWKDGGLKNWLCDSYKITETLYNDVKTGDKLSYRYNYDHISTLNQQLVKGGVRLAEVLNQVFKG